MFKLAEAGTGMLTMRLSIGARVVMFAFVATPFTFTVTPVFTRRCVPTFCTITCAWEPFFPLETVIEFTEASYCLG